MNTAPYKLAALIVLVAVLAAAGGFWFARRDQHDSSVATADRAAQRKVLYWYDPMYPNQHFEQPGKSPYMDMELVPKYADEGGDAASITIDPTVAQNFGVRFARVERGAMSQTVEAVGSIGFNQREVAIVQARSGGFVARVYARAPGDIVQRGAPLVDLVIPEWAAAQSEFVALLESGDRPLIDAARERMRVLGMPADLIEQVEQARRAQTTITVRTPLAGALESVDVREGMSVEQGATLAKVNGLETVWLEAAVPETQGARIAPGKPAEARLTSYPGEVFSGKVIAVLPEANVETRTLRVRIELRNDDDKLRPGMFARVRFAADAAQPALYVPSEAVIRTGTREVVIVADEQGRFTPTQVQTGHEADGKTVVLDGLQEGQKIVASGQFLIDSEANLEGVLARLGPSSGASASDRAEHAHTAPVPQVHAAVGTVESIRGNEIVISHEPVAALGWPAMTMRFELAEPQLAHRVQVGERVHFTFKQAGNDFIIEELAAQAGTP